ncbi:MAG: AAA family ATPase [Planctomycetes bacterium]|nr:AAA family ATPase [Planctomycetota bacterium]
MLTRMTIQNFRCFRSVEVPLKPLSVLIGPNDSGKSSFLRAIHHLAREGPGVPDTNNFWNHDRSLPLVLSGDTDAGSRVTLDTRTLAKNLPHQAEIQPAIIIQLPSSGPAFQCFGEGEQAAAPPLAQDGQNLAAILDYMLRNERPRWDAIVEKMREKVSGLKDIRIPTPNPAERRIDLAFKSGLVIQPNDVSVGVKLLLFFVTLSHHPVPPRIILLEEPEIGVHPKRLEHIVGYLRDITKGAHGQKPAQVIMTTHSPYILDHLDLKCDQVLAFFINEDGSRSAKPIDAEGLEQHLKTFLLGELWFNKDEKGLVEHKK